LDIYVSCRRIRSSAQIIKEARLRSVSLTIGVVSYRRPMSDEFSDVNPPVHSVGSKKLRPRQHIRIVK
jgi:hypothetical protein